MKTLLDYLEAGDSLDEFLDHFPSVMREQAIVVGLRSLFPNLLMLVWQSTAQSYW